MSMLLLKSQYELRIEVYVSNFLEIANDLRINCEAIKIDQECPRRLETVLR